MDKMQPLFYPPPYQDSVAYGRLILRDGSTASNNFSERMIDHG